MKTLKTITTALAIVLIAALAAPAGAAVTEQVKLTASDGAASDKFGWSVSISGDLVAVGAYRDDYTGTDSGSAYLHNVPEPITLGLLSLGGVLKKESGTRHGKSKRAL